MTERQDLDKEAYALLRELLDLSPEDLTDEWDDPCFPPLLMERIETCIYKHDQLTMKGT